MSLLLVFTLYAMNSFGAEPSCEMALANFEVLASNSDLSNAKVIGFGDFHDPGASTLAAIGTIAAGLARPGDLFLLEGLESGKVVRQAEYFPTNMIPIPVEVMGMDNLGAIERSLSLIQEAVVLEEACKDRCGLRMQEIERELFEKTKVRIMEMGRLLSYLRNKTEVNRIWIIAGVGHLHPEQSPLSFALERWGTPYVIFGPKGVDTEATLSKLKAHLARQEELRKKLEGH